MSNIIINSKSYAELEGNYFKVHNDIGIILSQLNLKPNDRLIYLTMLRFANNSGNPFPSYKKLREHTGIASDNTISASIKRLEEAGLIIKIHRGTTQGDSNVYQINYGYINNTVPEQPQKALESIPAVENIKPLPQQKKQPQKARNKKDNGMDSGVVIPWKRGVHDEVQTSKEAKEMLKYWESDEAKNQLAQDEERALEVLGLL